MLDGNSEVSPNIEVGLKFLRVLKGQLKQIIQQLDPILPVLLECITLVQLLKLGVIGGEVLAGHDLTQYDFLKLVIFYLDP